MMGRRRRRRAIITSTFGQRLVFAGLGLLNFVFGPLYSMHVLGKGLLDGDNIKMWTPNL